LFDKTAPGDHPRRIKKTEDRMYQLIQNYLDAKFEFDNAKDNLSEAEQSIIEAINNSNIEGTETRTVANRWKVSVSNKLNRTLDLPAYESIAATLPETLRFVEYKPSIVLKTLRHLEAIDPAIVAQCVTVKPAKPSIKIQEID
jgi:hypothetical protein